MEDEGKLKKVETGREKFAAYLKKKNASSRSVEQKQNKNEGEIELEEAEKEAGSETSSVLLLLKESGDVADKIEDADLDITKQLQVKVKELEEILEGKDASLRAALEGCNTPLPAESEYHKKLSECHKRLLEFEATVEHREGLIQQLSCSLQQALHARDSLQLQGDHLAQEVALLQRQLQATTELVQGHLWDTGVKPHDYLTLQNQMLTLEDRLMKHVSTIEELNHSVTEKNSTLALLEAELERRIQEFKQNNTKSALEIQELMHEVEQLHQQNVVATRTIASIEQDHQEQLAAIRSQLEENFGLQLAHIKEELWIQWNQEKDMIEQKHLKDMEMLPNESFKETDNEAQLQDLPAHTQQVDTLNTAKQMHDLELALSKQHVTALNGELQKAYAAKDMTTQELEVLRQSHMADMTAWKGQMTLLRDELRQVSEVSRGHTTMLEGCKVAHCAELAAQTQSHEAQVDFLNQQLTKMKTLKLHVDQFDAEELLVSKQSVLKETHKPQVDALNVRLQERNSELLILKETHKQQIDELILRLEKRSSELSILKETHKQQVDTFTVQLQEKNSELSILMETHKQQVAELNVQLQERNSALSILKETHKLQIDALNVQFQEMNSELAILIETHTQQVDALIVQLQERNSELVLLKDTHKQQVDALTVQLQERNNQLSMLSKTHKQQVDALNVQLLEKGNIENMLMDDLSVCRKTHKQQLDEFNTQLQNKCKTEEKLISELSALREKVNTSNTQLQEKVKDCEKLETEIMSLIESHKQQVKALSSQLEEYIKRKDTLVSELDYTQGELQVHHEKIQMLTVREQLQEAEVMSLKKQVQTQDVQLRDVQQMKDTYTKELELFRMEVADSSKMKEELIQELTLSIQSLEECNITYKQKLDILNTRLDDECQRADQCLLLHETYESEIVAHKQHIHSLESNLQDISVARDTDLKEILLCQAELNGYKEALETLNRKFTGEIKKLSESRMEEVKALNAKLEEAGRIEEKHTLTLCSYEKEMDVLNKNLQEEMTLKKHFESEIAVYTQQVEVLSAKLQETVDNSKELCVHKNAVETLRRELMSQKEHITSLTEAAIVTLLSEKIVKEDTKTVELLAKAHNGEDQERLLKVKLKELTTEYEGCRQELQQCNIHLTDKTEQLTVMKGELLCSREDTEALNSRLQEKLKTLTDALDNATETNRELQVQLDVVRNESVIRLKGVTSECIKLHNQLVLKENVEKTLNEHMDRICNRADQLNVQLDETNKQYCSLQEALRAKGDIEFNLNKHIKELEEASTRASHIILELNAVQDVKEVEFTQCIHELKEAVAKMSKYVSHLRPPKEEEEMKLSQCILDMEETLNNINQNYLEFQEAKEQCHTLQMEMAAKEEKEAQLNHVCELETTLTEPNVQQLKQQAIIVAKDEFEESLGKHIKDLEITWQEKTQWGKQENIQLDDVTVKHLKVANLLMSKEEGGSSLGEHIIEIEASLLKANETLIYMKMEKDQLILKLAKAEELLKSMRAEQMDTCFQCKQSEKEKEQSLRETESLEAEVQSLKQELANNRHSGDPTASLLSQKHGCLMDADNSMTNEVISSPIAVLKWMEQCNILEQERKELAAKCKKLQVKLQERDVHERLFNEEITTAQSRCKMLESRLIYMEKCESTIEKLIQNNVELKQKVASLENENKVLEKTEVNLRDELVSKQLLYEEQLQHAMQLGKSEQSIEELILGLGSKSKELIILKEQLKAREHQLQCLSIKVQSLEESHGSAARQFALFREEVLRTRCKLEDSWLEHEETEQELGLARKELILLQLQRHQVESSCCSETATSEMGDASILAMQQEVHHMVEELAGEVVILKRALVVERMRADCVTLEQQDSGLLEVQQKLELILKSNAELVTEKETLLEQLRGQQELVAQIQVQTPQAGGLLSELSTQQSELMEQLSLYREQNAGLAEVVGSAGLLQETLYQQKQELLLKFQEKADVEQQLEVERAELRNSQLKLQLLEQQLLEKDSIQQELRRQKKALETDLHEIEDRLHTQADVLCNQRLVLEAEIRSRDLHIRHWQLQLRAKEVEVSLNTNPRISVQKYRLEDEHDHKRLETLRLQLDEAHSHAVARLRVHLCEQFALREAELQEVFASELCTLRVAHHDELAALQRQLVKKSREVEGLVSAEVQRQVGVSRLLLDDLESVKEKHERELEIVRQGLDAAQVQLFSLLKHKFEDFTSQQMGCTLAKLKEEQESVLQQEVTTLKEIHRQELLVLGAQLGQQHQEELVVVRQELSLLQQCQGAENSGVPARLQQPTTSLAVLMQLKQLLCAEYAAAVEELLGIYQDLKQKEFASLTTQLEEALKEKVESRELVSQSNVEALLQSEEKLLAQLQDIREYWLQTHEDSLLDLGTRLDSVHVRVVCYVRELQQAAVDGSALTALRAHVEHLTAERQDLVDQHRLSDERLLQKHTEEVLKLRDVLMQEPCGARVSEMEAKHYREMEELRRYFEQKVAEVEKHYSEEIVSQHSRRLSDSSCGSDSELVADMYYAGGDLGPRVSAVAHICHPHSAEPNYKDLEEHYRADFDKHLLEYRDQLESAKEDLKKTYDSELIVLRVEYEQKVEKLVKELGDSHEMEICELKVKHGKYIYNLNAKWRNYVTTEIANLRQVLEASKKFKNIQMSELISRNDLQMNEKLEERHESKEMCNKQLTVRENSETDAEMNTSQNVGQEQVNLKSPVVCNHSASIVTENFQTTVEDVTKQVVEDTVRQQWDELQILIKQLSMCLQEKEVMRIEMQESHSGDLHQMQDFFTECVITETANARATAVLNKVELEHQLHQEMEHKMAMRLAEEGAQLERVATLIKTNTEAEQAEFMETQKQMMTSFLEQHHCNLRMLQKQYETQLQARQDEAQQLFATQMQQLQEKHEQELADLQWVSKTHSDLEIQELAARGWHHYMSEIQATHACDLLALHTEWREKVMKFVQSKHAEELTREMERLKENLINDQTSKFHALCEHLKAVHQVEIQHLLKTDEQTKVLLAADEQTPCPHELVSLQEQFVVRYKQEVHKLHEEHRKEIDQLKQVHETGLKQATQQCSEEVQPKDCAQKSSPDHVELAQIITERDNWKRIGAMLRQLVEELVRYLTVCEDELNNTLLGQLARWEKEDEDKVKAGDKNENEGSNNSSRVHVKNDPSVNSQSRPLDCVNLAEKFQTLPPIPQTLLQNNSARQSIHRVHFAPDLVDLLDESSLMECLEQDEYISKNIRAQLDICLERLKVEATVLFGLTGRTVYTDMETQVVGLRRHLQEARARVAQLEQEKASEIVTEGVGEHMQPGLSRKIQSLSQLQDRARLVLSEHHIDHDSPLLQLLEELCLEGDRLTEDARHERRDLQQQHMYGPDEGKPEPPGVCQITVATSPCCLKVDAADKQLRATRQFLEEQAAEREQERDEFAQEASYLQEQLRERERDRNEHEHLTKEVEALELQVREAAGLQQTIVAQREHLQVELEAAVDKIWVLREIITELEGQLETKTQHELTLEQQLVHQTQAHQELADELESLRLSSGNTELAYHVSQLEEQLLMHRQRMEQLQPGSGAVQQMKIQLRELEATVDKRTKELESLHMTASSASCSSPSEDVSFREMDVLRSNTPEELRRAQSPIVLPLDDLLRLQDKLQKHSRAEEAAVKHVKDLEMQLRASRCSEEEVTLERDVLQERVEEQLLKISSLQARVDQQRLRMESEQRQTTNDLQAQVHGLETSLELLRGTLELRDAEVKELSSALQQIRGTVTTQEVVWSTKLASEREVAQLLRQQSQELQAKHNELQSFLSGQGAMGKYIPIPILLETLLAEKNVEIEDLRHQLEAYRGMGPKSGGRVPYETASEPNQLGPMSESLEEVDPLRREPETMSETSVDMLYQKETSQNAQPESLLRDQPESEHVTVQPSAPSLEDLDDELKKMLIRKDSEIISLKSLLAERMTNSLKELRGRLENKEEIIEVLKDQLVEVPSLQDEVDQLKDQLQKTILAISKDDGRSRQESEELQLELERLHNEVVGLREEGDRLRAEAEVHQKETKQLSKLLQERNEALDMAHNQLVDVDELHESTKTLKDEVYHLREENARLLDNTAGPLDDLTGQVQKELDVSAQLDSSLMNKLTPSEETDEDTCKCSSSNTLLQKVLKKVLQHGMDVLTFNELTFLHQATCTATDTMANAEFNTPTPEHAKGDHQQMQRQIAALENEITRKQMDAAKRVHELEQAVRQEKKRIGDLHETLNQEQRRNLELQQHIKMQTHMQTDLELEKGLLQQQTSYHEDRLEQFIMMLEQERSKVRGLEDDLQKEKNTVKHLESLLEAERARAKATKFKDSELIESMRIKLENALDDATKQRFQMEEVQQHASLNKYDRGSEDNHKLHNATDYLAAQRAEIEVLGHKVQMLEDVERQWQHQQAVERVQAEAQAHNVSMQQLEMEQKILELEQKLLDSASGVSHVAASKAKDLARLREKLTEAQKELVTSKVQEMLLSQELTKLQHTLTVCQSELAGKKTQEALSNQELSRLREVLTDRQDKLVSLKIKETELKQEVSQLQHENFRSLKASEPFLQKLKNMNASLDQHMKDNTEVALTLARLVEERQVYEARIREMGECLAASQAQVQTSEANCQTIGTLLAAERLAWAREKTELQHDLAETHNQRTADTITDDRVNHLFGMYLRAESFRKALVWQKRYLLVVLGCYEDTEAATVSRLAQLSDVVYTQHKPSTWTTARTRFRSAVIVIISIQRMRYLVRRWHCGRRIGSSVVLSLVSGQSSYHDSRKHNSTRSLGLPRMGHSAERLLSPPSRDQPPQYWQHWRSSDPPPSSSQPSNCLADYVDRFDQLQHRLGLAIVHSPS